MSFQIDTACLLNGNRVCYPEHDAQAAFDAATEYLKTSSELAKGFIKTLKSSQQVFKIHACKHDSQHLHEEDSTAHPYPHEIVCWNPLRQAQMKTQALQSPAMVLMHEMGHALQALTNLELYEARIVELNPAGHYAGKALQTASKRRGYWTVNGLEGEYHSVGWKHHTESENIQVHETPVALQLKSKHFNEATRVGKACEVGGPHNCLYEDGQHSQDMRLDGGRAPAGEPGGRWAGKLVSEMTWEERVTCTVACPNRGGGR